MLKTQSSSASAHKPLVPGREKQRQDAINRLIRERSPREIAQLILALRDGMPSAQRVITSDGLEVDDLRRVLRFQDGWSG